MKEIQIEELRELQMQILDYVDAFCRKHDIKYTISGGTLLGAVRHGGYIPWDDDIDIQMRRDEYDRFTQLWNNEKMKHRYFEFISIESGNSMGYPFGKVHDTRTITYMGGYEMTGVYIDVFPVDYIVDLKDFRIRHKKIKRLYEKRRSRFNLMRIKYGKIKLRSIVKSLLICPTKPFNWYAERINELAKEKSTEKTNLIYEMVAGLRCKLPIPSVVFNHYKTITFEDRNYMSVNDTHTYLKQTFGDYMTLPPKEKQVSHHGLLFFWK